MVKTVESKGTFSLWRLEDLLAKLYVKNQKLFFFFLEIAVFSPLLHLILLLF